jgi:endonuclease III
MQKKELFAEVLSILSKKFPVAETELHYNNPFELLVSVILSAQCTDKRVNMVTPGLFEKFPTPQGLAKSHFDEVFPYIRSISYPNNKTKHLLETAELLVKNYKGEIPDTVEELVKLPGVGRKTAHVITSVLFNQPNLAVDTHVQRVSARIGLTQNAKTPLQTERQLVKYIPRDMIPGAHHWLILHGRYTCTARNPKCSDCELQNVCKYFRQQAKKKPPKKLSSH